MGLAITQQQNHNINLKRERPNKLGCHALMLASMVRECSAVRKATI
jgi:hypothetical protein